MYIHVFDQHIQAVGLDKFDVDQIVSYNFVICVYGIIRNSLKFYCYVYSLIILQFWRVSHWIAKCLQSLLLIDWTCDFISCNESYSYTHARVIFHVANRLCTHVVLHQPFSRNKFGFAAHKTSKPRAGLTAIEAWICKHTRFSVGCYIHPYPTHNSGLAKPPFKLRHGWIIKNPHFTKVWLLTHAPILTNTW